MIRMLIVGYVFAIRSERLLWREVQVPSERAGALPRDLVTQTEDVLVDTRGYIYVTDKQWGLWILRYTGSDQPAPTDK